MNDAITFDTCSVCERQHSIEDMNLCTVCKQFTCTSPTCDNLCQCRIDEKVERLLAA